jgi:hypothetical protein
MDQSLSDYISNKRDLTEGQVEELVSLLGKRCQQKTKNMLRIVLGWVPDIKNYGIFQRVMLTPRVHYCAGQSYPCEIRVVRRLLIGK